MANNLNQYSYPEDSIDLREIFKILLEFKKILISTILIFTLASISYSLVLKPSFISSTKLEIGYIDLTNGDKELIESTSNLVSVLKVLILKNPDDKFTQGVSINSFEDKIINLEIISSSAENNENLLNEIINYIEERHSNLSKSIIDKKNESLSFDIEKTKREINHFKSKLSDQYQSQYLNIISNLNKADQPIELLKLLSRNSINEDKVFSLKQSLEILNQDLKKSNSSVRTKSKVIKSIETEIIKPKTILTISIGIIFGFIAGILLVLIVNFFKKNIKLSKT